MGGRRTLLLSLVLFCSLAAVPAQAQDPQPGPMFLVIALDDADGIGEFDITEIKTKGKDAGSDTIIVRVGTLTGGDEGTTDVILTSDDPSFPLPKVQGEYLDLNTLVGNEATYFGTYEVYPYSGADETEPHMLTTAAAPINPEIQAAVFAAASALDAAVDADPFMRTGEIAGIVFDELASGSTVTLDQIAEALFGPDETPPLLTGDEFAVECEGELFPHEEDAPKLFDFKFSVTKDSKGKSAKFALEDLVRHVTVAVKESSVNPDKQGTMPFAILSSGGFDAADVDTSTVLLYCDYPAVTENGVAPSSSSISDQNGDGIEDLLLHFSVPDLKADQNLSTSTKTVTVWAVLDDGKTRITGTSDINTK